MKWSNLGFKNTVPLSGTYLLSLPYKNAYTDAVSLFSDIPHCTIVSRFNYLTTVFETWTGAGTNFTINEGEAINVSVSASSNFLLCGAHDPSFSFNLAGHGIYYVSLPPHAVYTKGQDLLTSLASGWYVEMIDWITDSDSGANGVTTSGATNQRRLTDSTKLWGTWYYTDTGSGASCADGFTLVCPGKTWRIGQYDAGTVTIDGTPYTIDLQQIDGGQMTVYNGDGLLPVATGISYSIKSVAQTINSYWAGATITVGASSFTIGSSTSTAVVTPVGVLMNPGTNISYSLSMHVLRTLKWDGELFTNFNVNTSRGAILHILNSGSLAWKPEVY